MINNIAGLSSKLTRSPKELPPIFSLIEHYQAPKHTQVQQTVIILGLEPVMDLRWRYYF